MCGTRLHWVNNLAWVPFPDPGEPNSTIAFTRCLGAASSPANTSGPRGEALVVAHDQLRLDLIDRIHGHADDDQQRGSSEVEVDVQTFEQLARSHPVHPAPD